MLVPEGSLVMGGNRETCKLPRREAEEKEMTFPCRKHGPDPPVLPLQPGSPPPVSRTFKSSDPAGTGLHPAHHPWAAQQSQSTYQGKSCLSLPAALSTGWGEVQCNCSPLLPRDKSVEGNVTLFKNK